MGTTETTDTAAVSLAARLDQAADEEGTFTAPPYLVMLQEFSASAHKAQDEILALAERTTAAQEDIVSWMSERGGLDAPGVLKGLLDFSRDFDSSFSRVYSAIGGANGARAWAARLSEEHPLPSP